MRIRVLVTTRKDAVTVPAVAVQRGPDGLYAWVIKSDNTVEQRPIQALTVSESLAVVTKGTFARGACRNRRPVAA